MYSDEILDRNLHPLHRRKMEDATVYGMTENGSCGDEIVVFLKLKDGKIVDASWQGMGCAIAQASADMMIERIKGKRLKEAMKMSWRDVPALEEVKNMPARQGCVGAAWKILNNKV